MGDHIKAHVWEIGYEAENWTQVESNDILLRANGNTLSVFLKVGDYLARWVTTKFSKKSFEVHVSLQTAVTSARPVFGRW
jgi:hypothetical protein